MTLNQGIQKFQTQVFPERQEEFRRLEGGQSPETLFITCSDSRIDPNLITQTAPGELFVIRNAGNIVPRPGVGELSVEATIQYAVDVLKVSQIIVCGHSHCGAVTGLLNLDSLESMPAIRDWVKRSEALLERFRDGELSLADAIRGNVLLQLDHLREYECVQRATDAGDLQLLGWVYHFESGEVDFLNETSLAGFDIA